MGKYEVKLTLTYIVEARDKEGARDVVEFARDCGFLPVGDVCDTYWEQHEINECNRKFKEDYRYDLSEDFGTMISREYGAEYEIKEV